MVSIWRDPKNLAIIIGLLLLLWAFVALLFYVQLRIALSVREDQYLKLPKESFGDFDKDRFFELKQLGEYPLAGTNHPNIPHGCETLADDADPADVVKCDDSAWRILPWVKDSGIYGCKDNAALVSEEFLAGQKEYKEADLSKFCYTYAYTLK